MSMGPVPEVLNPHKYMLQPGQLRTNPVVPRPVLLRHYLVPMLIALPPPNETADPVISPYTR